MQAGLIQSGSTAATKLDLVRLDKDKLKAFVQSLQGKPLAGQNTKDPTAKELTTAKKTLDELAVSIS